jgi:hypothetical protein
MLDKLLLKRDHGEVDRDGSLYRLFRKDRELIAELAAANRVSNAYVVRMLVAKHIEQLGL